MNFSRSIAVCILLCLSIHFMVCLAEQPLEISLVTKTVSSGKKDGGFVKVRVTDAAGNFASNAKVVLVKAYPTDKENTVLATKQEFTAVEGDNTVYQINFLALKPETGSYTLELQATPIDKKFSAVDASVNVRVTGTATVFDTQITVSDNDDGTEGKKYKVESEKKLSELKVGENQHVFVEFKVKGASGKNIEVHQAFVKISQPKTGREVIKVAEPSAAKGYQTQFSVKDLAYEFYGQSGAYDLQLIVGDFSIQNPIESKLATVQFTFPNSSQTEVPRSPFEVQPDIAHRFRKPDPRPPKSISMAFTGIALGIPFLVLFVGLIGVGANLSNFPGGSNFIWAIGFQASLGAILSLFGLYWLRLNMMQTLGYFTILAGPALFFAHKNLNGLSQVKQHED